MSPSVVARLLRGVEPEMVRHALTVSVPTVMVPVEDEYSVVSWPTVRVEMLLVPWSK